MNKKILLGIIVAAIATIIVGYAVAMPALNLVTAQQAKTTQISLDTGNKHYAHVKKTFSNESAGQWVFTISNISGTVKAVKIVIFKHGNPHDGFTWAKLNPSVGDSITVHLKAGNYTLHVFILGAKNSTLTLTVEYP